MKKALWIAACLSAALGTGVLLWSGDKEVEGLPWEPLNGKIEAVLALQEGTSEETDTEEKRSSASKVENQNSNRGEMTMAVDAANANNGAAPNISAADPHTAAIPTNQTTVSGPENVSIPTHGAVESTAKESAARSVEPAPDVQLQSAAAPVTTGLSGAAVSVPPADGKIHINSADVSTLMELPGIGEKKAQAILDYRAQNGPFQDVTDIIKVKGIGPKMLEKMLPDLAL